MSKWQDRAALSGTPADDDDVLIRDTSLSQIRRWTWLQIKAAVRSLFSATGDGLNYNSTTGQTSLDVTTALASTDTDELPEGGVNLYYTTARARGAIGGGTGDLSYNSATGQLSIGPRYETTDVEFTSFRGSFSTPVEILSAVASNALVPMYLVLDIQNQTVAFANGGDLEIRCGSEVVGSVSSTLYAVGTARKTILIPLKPSLLSINTPLTLALASNDIVTGDGELRMHIGYKQLTL